MKKLLKESDIRRMMKFANIGKLSESFLDRLEEEEIEEGHGDYKRDHDEVEEAADMEGADDMEKMGDIGAEAEEEGVPGAEDVDPAVAKATETLVAAVADAIADMPGAPPVSVDSDTADDAMGDEGPEATMPPAPEDEMPEDETAAALEEADVELEEDNLSENDEFINEVARRVAKRILKESKK